MAISDLTVRNVADASPGDVCAAFLAGFADYLVPIATTPPQLDARMRAEHVDPFASCLFHDDAGEPVAILLVARRGWVARVAAMGIAPAFRGTGLGAELIRRAISEARTRGDRRLLLEVIEANARAARLYAGAGFTVVRPLWGFALDAGPAAGSIASGAALEIDPALGAWLAGGFGGLDLPWQLQAPSLAALVRPIRCFTDARRRIVAMIDPTHDPLRLRAIAFDARITPADAAAFTAALRAMFPARAFVASPLFIDEQRTRFFVPGGWTTTDMRQLEMCHALDAGG